VQERIRSKSYDQQHVFAASLPLGAPIDWENETRPDSSLNQNVGCLVFLSWKKRAEDDLADIWLAVDEREAITRATGEIDRFLKIHPHAVGESRPAEKRILIVAPLCVIFRVYEDDRIVRVAGVWRLRTQ
jgi:hypothetical protein